MKQEMEQLLKDDIRLQSLYSNCPVVKHNLDNDGDLLDCLYSMESIRKEQTERILKLSVTQPMKVRLPDGRVWIWRCPEEMIPESNPEEVEEIENAG